jgi:hypothetical protein
MKKLFLMVTLLTSQAFGSFTYLTSGKFGAVGSVTLNTTGANLFVMSITRHSSQGTDPGDVIDGIVYHGYVLAYSISAGGRINELYYKVNPVTGASDTFWGCPSVETCSVTVYSGAADTPLDQVIGEAITTSADPTTLQPGSITPNCTKELVVIGLATERVNASITGATLRQYQQTTTDYGITYGNAIADSIQTAKLPINPTWTVSDTSVGGTGAATVMASFKAADSVCGAAPVRIRHQITGGE